MQASWFCNRGERVDFYVHTFNANWCDVGGIYMMCGRRADGVWAPRYIGKAQSLSDRLCNHPQWAPAQRLGATHVLARVVTTEAERDRLESMLVAELDPELNVQLRRPISGMFGLINARDVRPSAGLLGPSAAVNGLLGVAHAQR